MAVLSAGALCVLLAAPTALPLVATESRTPVITMERTACLGICPAYSLAIYADGAVLYEGKGFVGTTGKRESSISQLQVQQLVQAFLAINYFSLKESYRTPWTDQPTTITILAVDGKAKRVENYGSAAPAELTELECEIDRAVNTHQWLHPSDDLKDHGIVAIDTSYRIKPGLTKLMFLAARWHVLRAGQVIPAEAALKQEIQSRADVNARDETGWTALMLASRWSAVDNARLLLESGAHVNDADFNGDTALIAAAAAHWFDDGMWKAQTKTLLVLLEHGPDVNAKNKKGQTALMWIAQSANSKAVEVLLKAGADPEIRDEAGKSALDYAREMYDKYRKDYYAHRFKEVMTVLEKESCRSRQPSQER